jgi:uncharacterized membrane protein
VIADIVTGKTGLADIAFLVAAVVAVLVAVLRAGGTPVKDLPGALLALAVALLALGWLVL